MRVATKLSLFSSLILALTVITIGGVSLYTLNSELTKATIEQQGSVARVAAWGMQKYFPEFKFSVGKEGDIRDLRMPQLPEFTDNDMIDSIAKATGETATIFAWDPKTQDFWRKTTNIVKDNGLRAVGTSLGKKGRVYPVVSKGKTYIGEATILGKDYYTQYSPIKDNSNNVIGILYVGVEKAKSEAFYTNIALSIIITALIVLVVFGVVIVFISNKGVVPIKTLTDTMAKLAAGDLDQKVDALDRVDEIGDMARAVQVFKENEIMRVDLQAKQQEARKQDEARVKILGELTGEFNREVTNILGRVDESLRDLENASRALNDNAETTSHKASNMSATTQQSALSVEQVSAASEEFSASIREIASQVKHTTELLSESVEKTETASTRISRLSESSRKIQEVVSLINDISDQTNLLALNATIEAARAGEAGKGFAVVANEVKSLAAQTSKATEEIGSQIAGIQQEMGGAVSAIEEISDIMENINALSSSIAVSIEQQSASIGEITVNISEAAKGTQGVANDIGQVSEAARDTTDRARTVSNSTSSLSEVSLGLADQVKNFLSKVQQAS